MLQSKFARSSVQVLLFLAFSIVENTFSDTFEVGNTLCLNVFTLVTFATYELTKHELC